jgi:predicted lipoprotein with Yx(FWY)xxD motif
VLAAITAATVVGLTACSGGGSDGYGAAPAPAGPGCGHTAGRHDPHANSTAQLGTVVVDGQGFTLYRFDKDSAKPPTSNCSGDCASKWPPVSPRPAPR